MPSRERLEADIIRTRADQLAAQHRLDEAIEGEHHALGMVDACRAIQCRCKRLVDECADAICSLQDEIAALPLQRKD